MPRVKMEKKPEVRNLSKKTSFQPVPERKQIKEMKNSELSLISERLDSLVSRKKEARIVKFRRLGEIDGEEYIQNKTLKKLAIFLNSTKRTQTLELDFSGCEKEMDLGIEAILGSLRKMTSLKHLSFNFGSERYSRDLMTDQRLAKLCYALKPLSSLQSLALNLTWCREVTDAGLEKLSQRLKTLVSLKKIEIKLERCSKVTNFGLICLSQACTNLSFLQDLRLNLNECSEVNNIGLESLGESLKQLSSLKILDLSFGKQEFTDQGLETLSEGIGKLVFLKKINLQFNRMSKIQGKFVDTLRKSLELLICLEEISLECQWCKNLGNDMLSQVSTSFKKLNALQSVNLNFAASFDVVSEKGALDLGNALKSLQNLQTLNLDFSVGFFSGNLQEFGEGGKFCRNLKNFTLKLDSQTTDFDIENLTDILKELTHLKSLNLYFVESENISHKGMKYLCSSLKKLVSLENLGLFFGDSREENSGKISGKGGKTLGETLKTLRSLKKLHLDFSGQKKLGDTGLTNLCDGLENHRSLENLQLDLAHSAFSAKGLKPLAKTLKTLDSLKNLSLDFSFCEVTGREGISSLIETIKNLIELQCIEINLSDCSGVSKNNFEEFIQAFKNLRSLEILTFQFPEDDDGEVQDILSNLPGLKNFNFNNFY
jgi:hypothetical protein